MRSLSQERPAEVELCSSLMGIVQDNRKIDQLRDELSGFSHRCRNLLNGMKMSLYLVRRGADRPLPAWWVDVEHSYGGIEKLLDRLQLIYRPMTLTLVRAPFGSLVQDHELHWREYFRACGQPLEIAPPDQESSCAFDPMLLSGSFDAFLRWRASMVHPGQRACLSWHTTDTQLEVSWSETAIKATATRTQRHAHTSISDLSLALPLLARVITAHHGTIQLSPSAEFKVLFTCPLEQPETVMAPLS